MTLASVDIDAACRGERIESLITRCFDEHLELSDLAGEAADADDLATHDFYSQEASAWRSTAQVLRRMATPARAHAGAA